MTECVSSIRGSAITVDAEEASEVAEDSAEEAVETSRAAAAAMTGTIPLLS